MAQVPRYDTAQVEERPLPGVRQSSVASPALFGAAAEQQSELGKSLLVAGTAVNNIAVKMQERENADMIFRAETALKDEYLKYEQEVRAKRQGRFASGLVTDTEKFFEDTLKKHSDNLGNDVQRSLFAQRAQSLRHGAMSSMGRYQDAELEKSHDEGWAADKSTTISIAASDPTQVDKSVQEIDRLNRWQAGRKGWEPEQLKAQQLKDTTTLHIQVLQGMADANPTAAREYFDKHKAQIDGTSHAEIEKTINIGGAKQAGFEFAERNDIRGLTEAQAVTAARDFYKDEPEKREAAIAEINTRYAGAEQMRERGQRNVANDAWAVIGRGGRMKDIPAAALAAMDGRDRIAIEKHLEQQATGKAAKTDPEVYYALREMAAANPEAFKKTDLRHYVTKLSPSDFQEFVQLQTKPEELMDAATLTQQLKATYRDAGVSSEASKGAFANAANAAVFAEQKRLGKKLDQEGRQKIIDKLLIDGEVAKGGLYDADKKYYQVYGTEDAKHFVPEVPDTEREKIVEALKRRGMPVNDAEVTRLYKRKLGMP